MSSFHYLDRLSSNANLPTTNGHLNPHPPTPTHTTHKQNNTRKQVRYASAHIAASNPDKFAKSRGEYCSTHFKNMREVAAALSGEPARVPSLPFPFSRAAAY
jgi:hypothetical protein